MPDFQISGMARLGGDSVGFSEEWPDTPHASLSLSCPLAKPRCADLPSAWLCTVNRECGVAAGVQELLGKWRQALESLGL